MVLAKGLGNLGSNHWPENTVYSVGKPVYTSSCEVPSSLAPEFGNCKVKHFGNKRIKSQMLQYPAN